MHTDNLSDWIHGHVFDAGNQKAERGTRAVMWITAGTMLLEIIAGWWTNSMALLADGWHMSSHAVAIGLSAFAYGAARRYASDPRFAFGTWKIEILGGFASAVVLLGVAALMLVGSIERRLAPQPIHYPQALAITVLGLAVNLVCALILGKAHPDGHGHHHGHDHGHDHKHDHDQAQGDAHPPAAGEPGRAPVDLNLRSAYLHVVADAATSVLAIIALLGGWWACWSWLDPVVGIVGACLIVAWARGLIADTSAVLLDREMDHPVVDEIREVVESGPVDAAATRITDLHVWRVGKNAYSCALSLLTHDPTLTPARVRAQLAVHAEIVHATIEIQMCPQGHHTGPA